MGGQSVISLEINIVATVTENFNTPALITPSVYHVLLEQTKLCSLNERRIRQPRKH